ncbi:MAG: 3-deoxy-D-manno-octulosonic acid transferase [Rhodospirillaceae bacterium]|nr:3-deoxy-D-manno-octulosonic acid transferase [Rhodospirillaceae bacterium]
MPSSMLFHLYRAACYPLALAMPGWLRWRLARGLEYPDRWREKFGEASLERPTGQLIWCHAASIGESLSILPLIEAIARQKFSVLLTTGTVTSAQLVQPRLTQGALHQFAPLDHAPWIARFLDHWRPSLALRVDSEIWPNTLDQLNRRGIAVIQINGRLSRRAAEGWQRAPRFSRAVFSSLALVLAQSGADAQRFSALGATSVVATGNLKLALPPLGFDQAQLDSLKSDLGDRPRWLAASIHPGEDEIVASVHRRVKQVIPQTCLVVVPRHPGRGQAMVKDFSDRGLTVALRSARQPILSNTDVYIADTLGELGLFYQLCPVVFMGKTFAVGGGQNPAEPAQIGCALVWGPDMSNFEELAATLVARGGAIGVRDQDALAQAIGDLLTDRARAQAMAAAGQSVIAENSEALAKTLSQLAPYLKRLAIE